ncbi:MAG: tRNA preQ1(34) S-adenosylmethionine ribosyltransferase-isomerase QueA [Rickettsiales bacterium]
MTRTAAAPDDLLSSYDFHVPKALIATRPCERRDGSRLLAMTHGGITHTVFQRLPQIIPKGSVIVVNDSKVVPSSLSVINEKNRRALELTCVDTEGEAERRAFVLPARHVEEGDLLRCGEYVLRNDKKDGAQSLFRIAEGPAGFSALLASYGRPALPPYIVKERKQRGDEAFGEEDFARYQTVYADAAGSLAAPTAGLHFTPEILARCEERLCRTVKVTLHVGLGTFAPVKTDDVRDHVMHKERYIVSEEAAREVNAAGREGRAVICVGTTAARTLEAAWSKKANAVMPGEAETRLFIRPGYRFNVADALLTNFHLPKSTLAMLVSTLCGRRRMLSAYECAIEEKYRFFSYGDACFIVNPSSLHRFSYVQ